MVASPICPQRGFWKKNQQGLTLGRSRTVGDECAVGDFQGPCWEEQQPDFWSLGDKLGLGGAGDKPSSVLDGVFQDRRNSCLPVTGFICIFIFVGLRLQEALV